jgi:CheY-like chemotaxis protein
MKALAFLKVPWAQDAAHVGTPGPGTTFTVILPATEPEPAQLSPEAPMHERVEARGTVLVVDDEDTVRSFARRALESAGFATVESADAEMAVEWFEKNAGEIRSVLLDLTMPRMDGWQAPERLRRIQPDLPAVIMSGYSAPEALPSPVGTGRTLFLQKPFRLQDLSIP